MLKKFPSDKMNVTKNALFFLSRAPTHTQGQGLSLKICVWDFPLSIPSRFCFCSTKSIDSLT